MKYKLYIEREERERGQVVYYVINNIYYIVGIVLYDVILRLLGCKKFDWIDWDSASTTSKL